MSMGDFAETREPRGAGWLDAEGRVSAVLGGPAAIAPHMLGALLTFTVASAIIAGCLIVFGESDAVLLYLSIMLSLLVLVDFRIGVVCLIVVMPFSATSLYTHHIAGIPGLNPPNLLLLMTAASLLLHGVDREKYARFAKTPLWLYLSVIIIAGLLGSQHLHEVPRAFAAAEPILYGNLAAYLTQFVLKPVTIAMFVLLVAAAAHRARRPELFIYPMIVATWVMCLMALVFVVQSGASLAEVGNGSYASRMFFAPLGIHANELAILYVTAYAVMLYTYMEVKQFGLRTILVASLVVVVAALALTFSRGGYLGFAVVTVLFLVSRREFTALLLGATLLVALALFLPDAVLNRLGFGLGSSDLNVISSGRVGSIWLPLLAEVGRNPILGNGLGSIGWSDALRSGAMMSVGHPHNAYLAAALDTGVVGLVVLCGYFLHVWLAFRHLRRDPAIHPILRGFYGGAAAALVAFLVMATVNSFLTPRLEQIFLWLAIGLMYGERRSRADTHAS